MHNHNINTMTFPFPGIIFWDKEGRDYRNRQRERFYPAIEMDASEMLISGRDEQLLQQVIHIVEENLPDENFGVAELARETGLCRRQLHRKLRALANQSPSRFIRTLRLQRAAALIRHSSDTFSEIAYQTGFNTPNYFCKVFRKEFGCTPKEYRQDAALANGLRPSFASRHTAAPIGASHRHSSYSRYLSREAHMTTNGA